MQEGLEFSFTPLEMLLALPASLFCLWYYSRKHWFANNVLGLAFRCAGADSAGAATAARRTVQPRLPTLPRLIICTSSAHLPRSLAACKALSICRWAQCRTA